MSVSCVLLNVTHLIALLMVQLLHASWILQFYEFIFEQIGRTIIKNGWEDVGITETSSTGWPIFQYWPLVFKLSFLDETSIHAKAATQLVGYERINGDEGHVNGKCTHQNYANEVDTNIFDVFNDGKLVRKYSYLRHFFPNLSNDILHAQ